MIEENYFPGFNDDIQLEEFKDVKNMSNEKYGTKNTSLQIRAEIEEAYNKLFSEMLKGDENKIFELFWTIQDAFNINEEKAVRYLNAKNYEIVRNYAEKTCYTPYYKKLEENILKEKIKRKKKRRRYR